MKNLRLINGFHRLPNAELANRTRIIASHLTDNPHFPAPIPMLAEFRQTVEAFAEAAFRAEQGSRLDMAERNVIREDLLRQLHRLGNYVLFVANGNEAAALSSGFAVAQAPAKLLELRVPETPQLLSGANRGELEMRFRRVEGVKAYMYQITESPLTAESKWHSELNTLSRNLFKGLKSGTEYCCRVAAIGASRQVVYSGVVSRVAL